MRLFFVVFLFLAGAAGQQTTTPAPSGNDAQKNQQEARRILNQMIQALGGQAYLTLQDSFTQGRYGRFHNEVMVGGTVFSRYWKWPDQERYELTKERDIVDLYLGYKVFEITFRGAHEVDPKKDDTFNLALIRRHYSLERVLREWLNEPGTLLLDEGKTLADNKMAERITVINAKNEAVSILISPETHLPIQKSFTIRDPQTREREDEDEIYDNWRLVQGVNTPYSVVILHNGEIVRQTYLTNAAYNIHPPDSYFRPVLIDHEREHARK